MQNREKNPSAAARALFEALWPGPMRRLMVIDVPGGIAVIGAAFDVIVDLGPPNIGSLPKAVEHMRGTGRDLMLVNLAVDNSEGMVALCRFADPDDPASRIIGVSGLSFHLDARSQLALVHPGAPSYPGLILRMPRIVTANRASRTVLWHRTGITRAGLITRTVIEETASQESLR